jgi:hypothetical protein
MKTHIAVILLALFSGFVLGRFIHPSPVKAAGGAPRIVHVSAPADWAVVTGDAYGTPVAISCVAADCYVLMQGN